MYYVGKIFNTHGLKGEVKIVNESDFDRFQKNKVLYTDDDLTLVIESVRNQNKNLIVKFYDYNDLNDAELLKGKKLYTDEKPTLEDNEFVVADLYGKDCYTTNNIYIGKVKNVLMLPNQYVLEIKQVSKVIKMVPFVSEFIKEVTDEKIVIEPIEGLL